ncbi:iron-containing alcohol dehydrogenase [Oceanobacillus sojae]|uniref:iron-containing alcohol dehydrogenase n=1 Tax=Oceanobacillus sojae TaxID=582851 RepID=UPI0009886634|nr:iron-containing alcohol dehydrogenase [Oceanobacillus sojae]
MENFTFENKTKVIFGKETHLQAGREVKEYSKNILLHYGGGSIKKTGLYDRIITSLEEEGIKFHELSGVKPNPRLSLVREGIELCKKENIDFILAIGGGSVIDSAKAIATGVLYDGDVWDFYTNKATPEQTLPVGVVLTIAAAGSEGSGSSVITNEDGWYKRPLDTDVIKPAFSILNPELTYSLPKYQTMCGVTDIMSHIIERYFTNVNQTDLTDRLCEAALKTVINNGRILLRDPDNYAARAEIMWAGTLAHNGLLDTGRVGDWATHMIEHEVSGIYDVTHGAGLAALFPAWMRYVKNENLDRFVQFAVRVWDVDLAFDNQEEIALEGIRRFEKFLSEIGMPTSLSQLDIPNDRFDEMAKKCVEFGPIGNLKELNEADVLHVLKHSC